VAAKHSIAKTSPSHSVSERGSTNVMCCTSRRDQKWRGHGRLRNDTTLTPRLIEWRAGTERADQNVPDDPRPTTPLAALPDGPDAEPLRRQQIEAEYSLEHAVRCPACGDTVSHLKAIRLLRTQVNFTSTLPRRGRVLTCPRCYVMVPAELTNF
jgi:hypothetical protein